MVHDRAKEYGILIGSLEGVFRVVLFYNIQEINDGILRPMCLSMMNPRSEIEALDNFFYETKKLESNPLPLKIPNSLVSYGIHGGRVKVEVFKTHKKTARFRVSENAKLMGAETSDITFLVMHEYMSPQSVTLVDEKISFFQAKIEKNNRLFKMKPRQWYLMRYWPRFLYKGRKFNLTSCRRVPDVCSFYLLLLKNDTLRFGSFIDGIEVWHCETNSISLSVPYLGEKMPSLNNLGEDELLKDNDISLKLTQKDGDVFFRSLWYLFLTYLGTHDSSGVALMRTMFSEASKKNNPGPKMEFKESPSIGIRIRIQLKTEGFPR